MKPLAFWVIGGVGTLFTIGLAILQLTANLFATITELKAADAAMQTRGVALAERIDRIEDRNETLGFDRHDSETLRREVAAMVARERSYSRRTCVQVSAIERHLELPVSNDCGRP